MQDFGLYVIITRPVISYTEVARVCVECGVEMLQLREKHLSDRELVRVGREIKAVTAGTATRFVINDRPDIAVLTDADVLHLGQEDVSIADARRIVGEGMAIGLSTHSLAQAREVLALEPDYIGFGPIWATTTKACPDPTVGTRLLAEVLEFADRPVVAIGGIFPENMDEALEAGARNICMVRYLMDSPDAETLAMKINQLQSRIAR